MGKRRIILAYSGGLDTTVATRWLKNKGYEVIAYMVDIGQDVDYASAENKAKIAGAYKVVIEDLKDEFVNSFIFPALKANAVYESKYFLATALSRPLIAKGLVKVAKRFGAEEVAHGCTGKGNDQVRIEISVGILAPHIKVRAPVREWEFKSRLEQINFAKSHNIPVGVTKESPYSIDRNLWGVSVECGELEDPNTEPPQKVFQLTRDVKRAQKKPRYIQIRFDSGVPVELDGRCISSVELIKRLNLIGAEFGIGRSDMVENRLIGIKSREIYEAPAAHILLSAHKELEALVLDRELSHFKEIISLKYAELIYYGLWFTPLREAIDGFIEKTQKRVCGVIRVKLQPGGFTIVGRDSKYSLYSQELATYTESDKFDHRLAEGFIKIWALPYIKSDVKRKKNKIKKEDLNGKKIMGKQVSERAK